MVQVKLADSAGFCFGVKRAVDETLKIQKDLNRKIYTLGPLIHNNDVVNFLEQNNIFAISLEDLDQLTEEDTVVIRSHGVSKEVIDKIQDRGIKLVNATCPYVTNIQKKVNKYSDEGYKIVILGDKNHPEVIGINGWCGNNAIITSKGNIEEEIPGKVCVVSQTTEKQENWKRTINNVAELSKEFLAFNTICSATEVRQLSADNLSKEVDVMLVIGGKNSSNTTKLFQICSANCKNTYHIENINDIDIEEIKKINPKTVGVTAGASTPDWIITEVLDLLKTI